TIPLAARHGRPFGARTTLEPVFTLATLVCLFLASSSFAWTRWMLTNAAKVDDDIAFARLGLMLRDRVPPGTVIAAGWVGAPAYFSGFAPIDLLGKTDPHVASLPGTLPFRPGHNKMDLAYSVGELAPDLVLMDDPQLKPFGSQRLPNGLWVRERAAAAYSGSARSWCTSPSDSVY